MGVLWNSVYNSITKCCPVFLRFMYWRPKWIFIHTFHIFWTILTKLGINDIIKCRYVSVSFVKIGLVKVKTFISEVKDVVSCFHISLPIWLESVLYKMPIKVSHSEFCENWSTANPVFVGASTNFYPCFLHLLTDLAVIWRVISPHNVVRYYCVSWESQ